jgi:glyoxylase-like metal-dependent hydrolase (beta-lactamase superfamily II)/8-oxo-dGTP pyrophosphatase MutT (NUDIX family)
MPPAEPPSAPRDSASVVMFRPAKDTLELYWVRRERHLSFAANFFAFPGGGVDATDASVPVAGAEGEEAELRAAAARELFEETGVLVAPGAEGLSPATLAGLRRELLEHQASFPELLRRHSLTLRAADFLEAGRWVTPEFMPIRFNARFYLVEAPERAAPEVWPGELAEGAWVTPAEGLSRWQRGTVLLHPPALFALQTFAESTSAADASARMSMPPYAPNSIASRIEFQKGIRVFPLVTPTLPPATHTNVLVLGNGELLVVDPGAAEVRQYARLLALLAGFKAEGLRVKAVVITHHHQDHLGGAKAVKDRLGVPLWCHAKTAERLAFVPERLLEDGETLTLAGDPVMNFKVLHTPGHAPGHLCLVDELSKAAIVGDMVSGLGTVVIDPADGDMGDYLAQLRRLKDWPVGTIYPAHGPIIPDGQAKLAEYLEHRAVREQKVLAAVVGAGVTLKEVVATAYTDTPSFMHPIAEKSAEATLIKLEKEKKVARREGKYFPL